MNVMERRRNIQIDPTAKPKLDVVTLGRGLEGPKPVHWLPDIGASTLLLLALAAFVAGMARGFSGFGAALIFVPLAGALVGARLAAPLLLVIDGVFASYLIPSAWKLGDRREISIMLAGAVVGVPVGAAFLTSFAPLTLRWLIAAIAAAMLLLLISGWRYGGRPHPTATIAVGAISGVFSGIAQIGGPPAVAYWPGIGTAHAKIRANLILYFAASTLLALLSYWWGGLISIIIVKISLLVGPAYGVGAFGGSGMFGLATPTMFRNISFALIALAILLSLPPFGS